MSAAALIVWVVTAVGGLTMFAIWLTGGGLRDRHQGRTRFPPSLILSHFGLAATGLVLWIAFVASDNDAVGWVAAALLLPVAALGFAMLAKWLGGRATRGDGQPEQRIPPVVVVAHGGAAVTTVVLVVLTLVTR